MKHRYLLASVVILSSDRLARFIGSNERLGACPAPPCSDLQANLKLLRSSPYYHRDRRSDPRGQRQLPELNRPMIALEQDRPWRGFVTVERTTRDARDRLPVDDQLAVEHDRHGAAQPASSPSVCHSPASFAALLIGVKNP